MIPYEDLRRSNAFLENSYKKIFQQVLESGWYILGEQVKKFETSFADYHNTAHCIGVANGLEALTLSLRALELPEDAEVIVPSNTYIATILSILHCGLKPVLAEPDIRSYNVTAASIRTCITDKTKVILVVHLYGKVCPMDEIVQLANEHDLVVVEDCAQSHGAKFKGQLCGTFGKAAAFSFYPTKNLGALGDAGAIITQDDKMKISLQQLRNYGSDKKYHNAIIGYNSRLDELQAALLTAKLAHLDQITAHKRKLASLYLEHLKNDCVLPVVDRDYFDVFHIFAVRHKKRNVLRDYLLENGVGTEVHYPTPPHRQKALEKLFGGKDFPVSEEIHDTIVSLPCSMCHNEEDIHKIIELVNRF